MMQNPAQRTIAWGLREFDKTAPCLKPGYLVVLAGRPGMGKTGAPLASMLRAARDGSRALFFSLEMTPRRWLAGSRWSGAVLDEDLEQAIVGSRSRCCVEQGRRALALGSRCLQP
jgi:hypothetical protein